MDRIATVEMAVDCPHCGAETDANFDALATSGVWPKTAIRCDQCGEYFTVTASIDVDCMDEAAKGNGHG